MYEKEEIIGKTKKIKEEKPSSYNKTEKWTKLSVKLLFWVQNW